MQKKTNSDRTIIEKLRSLLDNPLDDTLHLGKDKYLYRLRNRLTKQQQETIHPSYRLRPQDDLKPTVLIHRKIIEKEPSELPEFQQVDIPVQPSSESNLFENEDLFEIIKKEAEFPEFIEVKPEEAGEGEFFKETKEKNTFLVESTEGEVTEDLPSWEPVEPSEPSKEDEEYESPPDSEGVKFIHDGKDIVPESIDKGLVKEQKISTTTFIKERKKEPSGESEFVETMEQIPEELLEIPAIDEKTAALLVEHNIKSLEELKKTSIRDLTKIKGIRRRVASKIKKEVEQHLTKLEPSTPTEQTPTEWEPTEKDEKTPSKKLATESKSVETEEWEPSTALKPEETKPPEEEPVPLKPSEQPPIEIPPELKEQIPEELLEIPAIDEKTAALLVEHNIKSLEELKKTSIRDLTKIKGIRRRVASKIKKEVEQHLTKLEPPTPTEQTPTEWEPTEKEPSEEVIDYLKPFRDISTINIKIAKLLYENGIQSVELLRDISIDELIKIKGISRRNAKKIKNEIQKFPISSKIEKRVIGVPLVEEIDEDEELPEWELKDFDGYHFGGYTLYKKEISIGTDKTRTVHFFSKTKPKDAEPVDLPNGYEVKINKANGVPYLRRKKSP